MPSILPGFEYDIFISYRHNDNRSGWVTEFVKALQEELAATIKEPVSVYFDVNPHDGLLETHNVDKSLEGKLKCLIFIPILSQTYCDPKSFAWQHEFVAFNKLAQADELGMEIKLSNGNVASRILPIKIHELDADDKSALENEMGGVLRAIEFTFKSLGVNRPLTSSDNPDKNQSKIFYKDQINKVANAIKEIITSIKTPGVIKVNASTNENNGTIIQSANSIAVLPFANMSSDSEQEFFSDGISEEIINMLAQVPGLKVAGRTSSFSFKGKNMDIREIGEKLNVNHILEGSVRKSGSKIRITAQLIKVSDGYHLYSERFDRELEDIFDIQDEIALAILKAIKIKLLEEEKRNLLKRYTDNPEAYQLYLQGRFHMNQFSGADALKNGIRYYEEAIKIEPEYALAYAGIASSYLNLWLFNYLPNEQSLPQMKQAVEGAMKLDNEIAESHYALANLKFWYEWDFKSGLSLYQKAIEINPNMAEAHVWYAHCLNAIRQHTKGFEHTVIAYNLDPFSLINDFYVGWAYLHAGHYEKALELGKRMIELEPTFYSGHTIAGTALMVQKKYEEAQAPLEMAVKLNYSFLTLGQIGVLYGMTGNETKAREILEEIEVLGKTQPLSNYDKGFVHIFIGEYELAAMHFEKGIELRQGLMIVAKDYLHLLDKNQYVPQIAEVLAKLEVFKRNH